MSIVAAIPRVGRVVEPEDAVVVVAGAPLSNRIFKALNRIMNKQRGVYALVHPYTLAKIHLMKGWQ